MKGQMNFCICANRFPLTAFLWAPRFIFCYFRNKYSFQLDFRFIFLGISKNKDSNLNNLKASSREFEEVQTCFVQKQL